MICFFSFYVFNFLMFSHLCLCFILWSFPKSWGIPNHPSHERPINLSIETNGDDWGSPILGNPHFRTLVKYSSIFFWWVTSSLILGTPQNVSARYLLHRAVAKATGNQFEPWHSAANLSMASAVGVTKLDVYLTLGNLINSPFVCSMMSTNWKIKLSKFGTTQILTKNWGGYPNSCHWRFCQALSLDRTSIWNQRSFCLPPVLACRLYRTLGRLIWSSFRLKFVHEHFTAK